MPITRRSVLKRASALAISAVLTDGVLTGCSTGGDSGDGVTITLSGPNQWNSKTDTFGPEWDALVAKFEAAEPNIKVKTVVLPLSSFSDTLTTELTAGTAPELIFNQPPPSDPSLVVSLDPYLAKPNPYNQAAATWLAGFNKDAYGDAQRDAAGHLYYVPFNLVTTGLFYNKEIFDKLRIKTPIAGIGDFLEACDTLSQAGYTPLAMDNGLLGTGWTAETLLSNLLHKYGDAWNVYGADGKAGTAATLTNKSLAHAILTGKLNATTNPEVAEAVKLLKEIFTRGATKNWTGVASSATFVGGEEFLAGKAAMAWGTNFVISNFSQVSWKWSSMPFPTVTTSDTSLADGSAARYGAVAGGTSYMIPATMTGEKLDAAITFLQFATSPQGNGTWVAATNAIPATSDVSTAAAGLHDLLSGEWAKPRLVNIGSNAPSAESGSNRWEGYLLGTRSLEKQLKYLQDGWVGWAKEIVKSAKLTDDWATHPTV
ncbi:MULTISPECIES: ABC transporter substrate-binding protein [unclassified Streptomyces]|uniref:ABC transporter substrate-binding protein n=1 Tax=unclassified Streptomyces TaxID=2593676 RepID=UPI0036E97B0A